MYPDNQASNLVTEQSSSMSTGATVLPNYSLLLPAPSDGTTGFGDFVTQFNFVASLSDWQNQPSGDMHPS